MINLSYLNRKFQKPTIFCDFDGPLVDVSNRYYSTYKLALAKTEEFYRSQGQTLSLNQLSKEQFWQMKQERVSDIKIARLSGLRGEQIDFCLQQVQQVVNDPQLLSQDKLQPGVKWALALLHAQGARLVLVTLRCQEQVREILREHDLQDLFSDIYGSQDCSIAYQNNADRKTELLSKAVAKYGAHQACMIGDTEADLIAAQEMGIDSIAVTCGIRSANYLKQFQPNYIYSDLLSTAHQLVGIHSLAKSA